MWKWFYYTPNTLKEMYARQQQLAAKRGETVDQVPRARIGHGYWSRPHIGWSRLLVTAAKRGETVDQVPPARSSRPHIGHGYWSRSTRSRPA